MGVDTSIQYNGYNSYKFVEGDVLNCYPFGVQNMEYITHSFGAYSPIALSSGVRATTKFFDKDSQIIQSVDHSFNIGVGIFEDKAITAVVPTGAVKAQLTFKNTVANPWWVACPKTEEGQNATPYAVNAYGQMTYITPNGIYTGIITANQIVLASSDETLGDRLVTINANQIGLEREIDGVDSKVTTIEAGQISLEANALKKGVNYKGTKITAENGFENTATIGGKTVKVKLNATEGLGIYANDVFIGGLSVINGDVGLTAKRIAYSPIIYGEIGVSAGNVGLGLYDLRYNATPYVRLLETKAGAGFGAGFGLYDANGYIRFHSHTLGTTIRDANNVSRVLVTEVNTILMSPDNQTILQVSNGSVEVWVNNELKERWS